MTITNPSPERSRGCIESISPPTGSAKGRDQKNAHASTKMNARNARLRSLVQPGARPLATPTVPGQERRVPDPSNPKMEILFPPKYDQDGSVVREKGLAAGGGRTLV